MGLGQTAVGRRALQGRAGVGKLAEGVDRDARYGPLMRCGAERLVAVVQAILFGGTSP